MADERGRLVQFVAKLNRMTQEGRIKWQSYQPPEYLTPNNDDEHISFFWGTRIDDKNLALYVRRYMARGMFNINNSWEEKIVLAFCQNDWTPVWEFPPVAGINELRNAVVRQSIGVDSFIDKILSEENN